MTERESNACAYCPNINKVLAIIYKALVITNEERGKIALVERKKSSLIKSRWKKRSRKSLANDIRIP